MDGVSEDSPLLPVVLAGDYLDRLLESWPPSLLTCLACLVLASYALCGCVLDLCIVLGLVGWQYASVLTSLLPRVDIQRIGSLTGLLAGLAIATLTLSHRIYTLGFPTSETTWDGLGSPYLIPSRTSHTRFFPKKHSFSYSYLVVGIPVGFSGNANGIISADVSVKPSSWFSFMFGLRAWFDVNPVDYLQRGGADLGLRGKLDNYLRTQVRQQTVSIEQRLISSRMSIHRGILMPISSLRPGFWVTTSIQSPSGFCIHRTGFSQQLYSKSIIPLARGAHT